MLCWSPHQQKLSPPSDGVLRKHAGRERGLHFIFGRDVIARIPFSVASSAFRALLSRTRALSIASRHCVTLAVNRIFVVTDFAVSHLDAMRASSLRHDSRSLRATRVGRPTRADQLSFSGTNAQTSFQRQPSPCRELCVARNNAGAGTTAGPASSATTSSSRRKLLAFRP